MYAIFDCDNCFVSCERVFRPDLTNKPVIVLGNNDGCVVARSQEAKALGIKNGMPYFKLKKEFPDTEIHVFSSNHELYRDMTQRVMSIIKNAVPEFHRYSIDEAFCILDGMDNFNLKEWGENMHAKIMKCTGIPVSIGIAKTKTLAKCADRFAKDYPGYKKCCIIDSENKRKKALELFPVKEIWGIGRQMGAKLEQNGVKSALDFANRPKAWVRREFHITGERTWMELHGEDCIPTEHTTINKSISVSRSFPEMITDFTSLRTYISNFAAQCSEKLRQQQCVCRKVSVFIETNRFRTDLSQYTNCFTSELLTPDNCTQTIVRNAVKCLKEIFRYNYLYKRAGVTLSGICDETCIQTNFLDFDVNKHNKIRQLTRIIDNINLENGNETIILGSQQYKTESNSKKTITTADTMRHKFRNDNFTTKWKDIIRQ